MPWNRTEWTVRGPFMQTWRLSFAPIGERFPAGSHEDVTAIGSLVYWGFERDRAIDDQVARPLLEIWDALENDTLSRTLPVPTRDPRRLLRAFEPRIRSLLENAVRYGGLRIEEVLPAPWPFADEEPAPPPDVGPPAPPSVPDVAHYIELRVVTTKGDDVPNVACEIAFADGTIAQGLTGPDGILHLDGLEQSGVATVVLPDLTPFSPTRARQPPSNDGAVRITQDGVSASIDAKTLIEIPPQVYRGRLIGMFFDKNKSFLLPGAMVGIRGLTSYFERHADAQLLVVGHTDTTGDADYNLTLSIERAKAVAAYLKDDVDTWTEWFGDDKPDAKRWGILEVQRMLSALPDGQDTKFYAVDPPTGRKDASTRDAVSSFQEWSNQTNGTSLDVDGDAGPATRPKIVRAYMAIEGTSVPHSTVLKTHGCGEFHPQEPTAVGVDDPENRRVEVFVFDDLIDPPPQACRSPGCTQYAEWVERVVETVDFTIKATETYDLFFDAQTRPNDANESYRLVALDGSYDSTLSRALAFPAGQALILRFTGVSPGTMYELRQELSPGSELPILTAFTIE